MGVCSRRAAEEHIRVGSVTINGQPASIGDKIEPGVDEVVFEGEVRGSILRSRKGANGFGYDPVFLPEGRKRTTAEMSQDEKAVISHRGIATRKFIAWLKKADS